MYSLSSQIKPFVFGNFLLALKLISSRHFDLLFHPVKILNQAKETATNMQNKDLRIKILLYLSSTGYVIKFNLILRALYCCVISSLVEAI